MKLKVIEKSIIVSLLFAVLLSMTGFAAQCNNIQDEVLRLHVLANSDSQEDQTLKLQVRDRVLEYAANLMDHAGDRAQAEQIAAQNLQGIQKAAQQEVYDRGYNYPVQVQLTNMYFNTRQYDTVTLPAGDYDALRITIGEAAGKNWWCVMFPPMCLPAAEESRKLEDVLNADQMDLVQGGTQYEVKFKVVEIFEGVKNWMTSITNPAPSPSSAGTVSSSASAD